MATTIQAKRPRKKKSVLKRIRQTERRTAVNRVNRSRVRTQIKKLRRALESGKAEEARALLQPTLSLIDRSIQKGVLHRNTANRYKSRLHVRVKALMGQQGKTAAAG